MMRGRVAYSCNLSLDGLFVRYTRQDQADRRHDPPADSSLHHHAGPRVAVAVLRDIAVGVSAIIGGVFLRFASQELPYQWLWIVTAEGMIATGAFLSIETHSWRGPVIDWYIGREGIDYRFRGLGLCTLAVLLLYAIGWIGRN